MNKIIVCFLSVLLTSCQQHSNDEFKGFRVISISMGMKHYLNMEENKVISEKIIGQIINAERIKGPVKGIGIEIKLVKVSDTIQIMSYGGSEYFRYNGEYYKAKKSILSDSIIKKFIY
ncbi:MAG: hypothetical protein WC150_07220 [Bacteroidia bacterium]